MKTYKDLAQEQAGSRLVVDFERDDKVLSCRTHFEDYAEIQEWIDSKKKYGEVWNIKGVLVNNKPYEIKQ